MTQSVLVGSRLSYAGELCTVRFIGEIPAWPNEVAYGVEWDNVEKGKHDGSFKGISYFKTTNGDNSGSFLKSNKKYDDFNTFYKSLVDTYGTTVEDQEIKIGVKLVQSYGFDKLQRLQSDFNYLKTISLNRKCLVGCLEEGKSQLINSELKNLQELDLSFNLFIDLSDILSIIKPLSLNKLNLTGNRLQMVSKIETIRSIRSLNLTLTTPTAQVLDSINTIFPNLDSLYLQDNSLTDINLDLNEFENITLLDISMNELNTIPNILTSNESITNLNLSDNMIKVHQIPIKLPNITTLDIRRNEISTWKEIELINEIFPNVEDLRINGNPIFDGKRLEEVEYVIIGMFPKIKSLNGVTIDEQERINSELYLIAKVSDGEVEYDPVNLKLLCDKYGKDFKMVKIHKNNIDSNLLSLRLQNNSEIIELEVIETLEFIRLRGLISRLIEKDVLDFQIYYYIGPIKELIKNDISLISSFKFEQGQSLFIEDI